MVLYISSMIFFYNLILQKTNLIVHPCFFCNLTETHSSPPFYPSLSQSLSSCIHTPHVQELNEILHSTSISNLQFICTIKSEQKSAIYHSSLEIQLNHLNHSLSHSPKFPLSLIVVWSPEEPKVVASDFIYFLTLSHYPLHIK